MEKPILFFQNLVDFIDRQSVFSHRAFGPGRRTKGIIAHIRKELAEVEANPEDLSEWVDIMLLAMDGAWRHGHTPADIALGLETKLARNEQRTWPDWRTMSEDDAIEHIRESE